MARPKLPAEKVKETVGVKLPRDIIAELARLGALWDCAPSAAGRELLLLGLAVLQGSKDSKIFQEKLNHLDIVRSEDLPHDYDETEHLHVDYLTEKENHG